MMLKGSYVALVTPFKNGEVDYSALEALLDFHLNKGTHGILLLGTTAETAGLASDEKDALLRFAIHKLNRRVRDDRLRDQPPSNLANTMKAKELAGFAW